MARIGKGTHSNVSVGTSSVSAIAESVGANQLLLQNDHASNTIYLRLGSAAAVANEGIRLGPGESFFSEVYTGAIQAIATGAATKLLITRL